ncbi:MAG: hypothetical protein U9N86_08530 [Bacteroidota bacterium]|nr:hypothetical protein [Bacteroidota bacterium]
MKKTFRIIACLAVLLPLAIGTQSFIYPEPIPQPQESTWKLIPNGSYYDIKFSIYQIVHDGGGYFNEGPFYATSTTNNVPTYQSSQWTCAHTSATYARVWTKAYSGSSWVLYGDMHVNEYNATQISGSTNILMFTFDMDLIDQD